MFPISQRHIRKKSTSRPPEEDPFAYLQNDQSGIDPFPVQSSSWTPQQEKPQRVSVSEENMSIALRAFYAAHNPSKLEDEMNLNALIQGYRGNVEMLQDLLRDKYGAEMDRGQLGIEPGGITAFNTGDKKSLVIRHPLCPPS